MKIMMTFGDPYHEGHGYAKTILVEAPSVYAIDEARIKMAGDRPGILNDFAIYPENPCPGVMVWGALRDTKYPVERLVETCDDSHWENKTLEEIWKEVYEKNYHHGKFTIDFIIDTYLWLLRHYGAEVYYEPVPELYSIAGFGCYHY